MKHTCDKCGASIGVIGRIFQRFLGRFAPHKCPIDIMAKDLANLPYKVIKK